MTIEQLHQDEAVRKQEFPVCAKSVFLAHAAVCAIPWRVSAAMVHYASECVKGDQEDIFPKGLMLETRKLSAQLLGCASEEIALVGPTSIGLSMIANGLDWCEGDNVVFYAEDYPSNVVPWMALASRGVQLREIRVPRLGEITLADITPLVNHRTRLVALASAHFISGYSLDLNAIGQWLHSQGVLFCVDGIQTIGVLRTSVVHVDFLAADAHKWLLGPCSTGILFVRQEAQKKLHPTLLGWNNVLCPGFITPQQIEFPQHAGRYEAGTYNLMGVVGLHAVLALLLEYGMTRIEQTVLDHTRWLRDEIRKRGYELASLSDKALSGITTFRRENTDMAALYRKFRAANIVVSLRETRDGKAWLRFSPHFYNTHEELERAAWFF